MLHCVIDTDSIMSLMLSFFNSNYLLDRYFILAFPKEKKKDGYFIPLQCSCFLEVSTNISFLNYLILNLNCFY